MDSEYPPLFPAGFHDVEADGMRDLFSSAAYATSRRAILLDGLERFLEELRAVAGGVEWEIWLDGSFSTEKPEPSDIDMLVVADPSALNGLSPEVQRQLAPLLNSPGSTKARYGCEVYFVDSENAAGLSYWRGWFGFSRNESPKGIPRLRIA